MTKKNIFVLCLSTFCLCLIFFKVAPWNLKPSKVEELGLFSDVSRIREYDRTNPLDISSILKKYIPIGSSKQDALSYLKKNGFTLSSQENTDQLLAVKRSDNSGNSLLLGLFPVGRFKYRIIIKFDNNKVENIDGELIYQAL